MRLGITSCWAYSALVHQIVVLFGVVGQFYSVVLVGILISKFAAASGRKD